MKKDAMELLKLNANDLEGVAQRLHVLELENSKIANLAYADSVSNGPRCGCKGSCEGGCTSW